MLPSKFSGADVARRFVPIGIKLEKTVFSALRGRTRKAFVFDIKFRNSS